VTRKVESVNIDQDIRPTLQSLGVRNFSGFVEQRLSESIEELRGLRAKEDKTLKSYRSRLVVLADRWDALQAKMRGGDGGESAPVSE